MKQNTRLLISIIVSFLAIHVSLYSQEMSVAQFYEAERDLTANTPGTMVHDQNGKVEHITRSLAHADNLSTLG